MSGGVCISLCACVCAPCTSVTAVGDKECEEGGHWVRRGEVTDVSYLEAPLQRVGGCGP